MEVRYGERYRSEAKSGEGPRRSPVKVLGMHRGWVGNGCGPNRRIGHGYNIPPPPNTVHGSKRPQAGIPVNASACILCRWPQWESPGCDYWCCGTGVSDGRVGDID